MQDTILYGFRLDSVTESEELGGRLHRMTHIKTGAELAWLDNGQDNKVFSIAFKTVPWDDSGVFHILEHSVLCGSEKYPVKEPSMELLKGSMQTYLNAMTFPDKTIYPVSSQNEKDFLNLVEVYLDAVFRPAIYQNKNIFLQEGWHYELPDSDATPSYKGVVLSEMTGACGSVDSILDNRLCRLLYPDSCYRFHSGGDPAHIPFLSYEAFLQAHRDFYHPGNARIYLDGKVPLEAVLKLMDGDYLSKYEKADRLPEIPLQHPVAASSATAYYEVGKDEDLEGRAHWILGKQLCNWQDRKTLMAFDILASYLTGSNAAPLKQAILESELAQDVYMYVSDAMAQPYFALCLRNLRAENIPELQKIIKEGVRQLLDTGLEPMELEANLNQLEYMLLEAEEPRGIQRAMNVMNTWLYGGDPLQALKISVSCRRCGRKLAAIISHSFCRSFCCRRTCPRFACCPPKA